ncbi:70-kilodalton heat shock protein [Coelomomyces lativittatus]|nr:70-kilodalton heat shock protein [Coelomomyces lativittatus]
MINEAELHKQQDEAKRESIEERNRAETFAEDLQKQLEEHKDKLPKDDVEKVRQALQTLRDEIQKETATAESIRTASDELKKMSLPMFDQIHRAKAKDSPSQDQDQSTTSSSSSTASSSNDDASTKSN